MRFPCCGGEILRLDSHVMSKRPDGGTPFLRARREALGLSVTSLAHVCGISKAYLSNLEAGRRRPSPEVALTLAYHLETPLAELGLTIAPERTAA